jgi:NAD+ synthase
MNPLPPPQPITVPQAFCPSALDGPLDSSRLQLDCASEVAFIRDRLRLVVGQQLRRRGVVVALSGGVDSSVCVALAARAFGPSKVLALLLPERESSAASTTLGQKVAEQLGVPWMVQDVTPALEALGCYQQRDDAIRRVFPAYTSEWKSKIVIAGGEAGGLNFFKLVVRSPGGQLQQQRLPHGPYLQIVAAQSYKQRVRKTIEFFHADRANYAVVGTPNRLEYDQGFFVKNGDGAADVKPIAHLYKTQVYALARHLGLPEEICTARPTTDTYSLEQGQDEFYFTLPYEKMDLALWACNHGVQAPLLAGALGVTSDRAEFIYRDIAAKRETTRPLHARAILLRPVDELRPLA